MVSESLSAKSLALLAAEFERVYGLRTDPVALGRLAGAIRERKRALVCSSDDLYLDLLERDVSERERVLELVLIGETAFFRTAAHFEALERHVLPWLDRALPPGEPIRLWSAGCSSGEEAYSLAMVCSDALAGRRRYSVLGSDLSAVALRRAEAGIYPRRAASRLSADRLTRYFETRDQHLLIREELRDHTRFERVNLLGDQVTGRIKGLVHVILCENVLIYFTPAAIERALRQLAEALAPNGLLFLGYSERLPRTMGEFESVELEGAFAWRKLAPGQQTPARDAAVPKQGHSAIRRNVPKRPPTRPPLRAEATGADRERARRPGSSPRARPSVQPDGPGQSSLALVGQEYLRSGRAFADQGLLDEALEHARHAAEALPLSEAAHSLLGELLAARGEHREAIRAFERAIYLAPDALLARFQLASLMSRLGKRERARREFASLAARLEQLPLESPIGELSVGLLLRVCREELQVSEAPAG